MDFFLCIVWFRFSPLFMGYFILFGEIPGTTAKREVRKKTATVDPPHTLCKGATFCCLLFFPFFDLSFVVGFP